MYSVNDVIAGRYRVLVVRPTTLGSTVCHVAAQSFSGRRIGRSCSVGQCVRLVDDAMFSLECVELNGALLPEALEQYETVQSVSDRRPHLRNDEGTTACRRC